MRRLIPLSALAACLSLAAAAAGSLTPTAGAALASTCVFNTSGTTMTLAGSCQTDETIYVPDGFTLDGAGHTITAVDPVGGDFRGAVVQNEGETAYVKNLKITASSLAVVCHSGADRLRGIMFQGASGAITNSEVTNLAQANGTSGCQEGNAIEVRNFGDSPATTSVIISGNKLTNYQKTGVLANGDVNVSVSNNTINGGGPNAVIARNGVQIGFGGDGQIKDNAISGNSYNGPAQAIFSASGIILYGEVTEEFGDELTPGVQVLKNTLSGNDMGVYIGQFDVDSDFNYTATTTQTNIKVVNNVISKGNAANTGYTVGVYDAGNNDKIITNRISGYATPVDVDPAYSSRAKVHANR